MKQRGFSSVLLIFIIVALAGMTRFALQFVAGSQGASTIQLQAQRAKRATDAAMEWQRYRLKNGTCTASINVAIPSSSGPFNATTTCVQSSSATEAGKTIRTYRLTATACAPAGAGGSCPNFGQPDYVERSVVSFAACNTTAPITCTW
jgi:Tfp pilus assembly protein PilX